MATYNPVELAIQAVGGKAVVLAKMIGVSHQAVSAWLKKGSLPLRQVIPVSKASGVPKQILCPQFFE